MAQISKLDDLDNADGTVLVSYMQEQIQGKNYDCTGLNMLTVNIKMRDSEDDLSKLINMNGIEIGNVRNLRAYVSKEGRSTSIIYLSTAKKQEQHSSKLWNSNYISRNMKLRFYKYFASTALMNCL